MPKTILCFGDSNTWGFNPLNGLRLSYEKRWNRILQRRLPGCYLIEEGMNGRTIAIHDDLRPWRCGLTYLPVSLKSHDPIDLVILMLGTNDLKSRFCLHASDIASSMDLMLSYLKNPVFLNLSLIPDILLISPPPLNLKALKRSGLIQEMNEKSAAESELLSCHYQALSEKYHTLFLDSSKIVSTADTDGVHLDEEGHTAFSNAIFLLLSNNHII